MLSGGGYSMLSWAGMPWLPAALAFSLWAGRRVMTTAAHA